MALSFANGNYGTLFNNPAKASLRFGRGQSGAFFPTSPRTFFGSQVNSVFGPYIINASDANIAPLIAAIKAQNAGSSRAKIGFLGTSIVVGNATGTGTNGQNGAGPLCYPSKVKDLLVAASKNARIDSLFADHKIAIAQIPLYDTRVEVGSTSAWGPTGTSTQNTLGGDRLRNNTDTNATAIRMTPTGSWDTVDTYDLALSGGPVSAIQPSIGGVLVAGVPSGEANLGGVVSQSNATTIYRKATLTTGVAAAVQAFNWKRIAAGTATVYFNGFDFYNSASPDIAIYNWGQSGASSEFLAANALSYNPMQAITVVQPHATFVDAVTNDVLNEAATDASIVTNLRTIYTASRAAAPNGTGQVVFCVSPPVNAAGATQERQDQIRSLVINLGIELNVPVIDSLNLLGGTWAIANASGYMGDSNHPNATGAALIATLPYALINRAYSV